MAPMERPSRLPLYLGIILLVAGWVVIGLAWWQSGNQELETGQLPYVISGGFGGFGLILMGLIGITLDVVRQSESKLRNSANELHARMEEIAESFLDAAKGTPRTRRRKATSRASAPDEQ